MAIWLHGAVHFLNGLNSKYQTRRFPQLPNWAFIDLFLYPGLTACSTRHRWNTTVGSRRPAPLARFTGGHLPQSMQGVKPERPPQRQIVGFGSCAGTEISLCGVPASRDFLRHGSISIASCWHSRAPRSQPRRRLQPFKLRYVSKPISDALAGELLQIVRSTQPMARNKLNASTGIRHYCLLFARCFTHCRSEGASEKSSEKSCQSLEPLYTMLKTDKIFLSSSTRSFVLACQYPVRAHEPCVFSRVIKLS